MEDRPSSGAQVWDELAEAYTASRHVSSDWLIEWPAQLRLAGEFKGKHILDMGCGTGDKARYFAENGAASVLGIDASSGFAKQWATQPACKKLTLRQGSFEDLSTLPLRHFELIVCYQALMYASNLKETVKAFASLLTLNGTLTISVPHPFRFAILKSEIEGWQPGFAYQQTQPHRYPSPWKPDVMLEHAMPRLSDYLNAIAEAGLRITASEEPAVPEDFRQIAPEKAAWMDSYTGILVLQSKFDG